MIERAIFRMVREQDFLLRSALDLRPYTWGSLAVYDPEVRERMANYQSKYDLLNWMKYWTEPHRLVSPFIGIKGYEDHKILSRDVHRSALRRIFSTPQADPHAGYDIWNAIDGYIVDNHCKDAKVILDFGSGYGRLGAIFASPARNGAYISVDCVETSYMLQSLFLSQVAYKFSEYVDFAFERKTLAVTERTGGAVYHIPSWRLDLIPDNFVDAIVSIFVLPEINDFAVIDFVAHARRIVRPGGHIYLRDHLYHSGEKNHIGGHRQDTAELLSEAGFTLIHEGKFKDNVEIYGTPRVFQRAN